MTTVVIPLCHNTNHESPPRLPTVHSPRNKLISAPSFHANSPSPWPLRNFYPSIPAAHRIEEMEEKENVNKIPKID
jgi:hypothetical protein